MLTLIFPYRDRDIQRVKRSLDSLKSQSDTDFSVAFVDYGSSPEYRDAVKDLVDHYDFVTYSYLHVVFQPWNKSRALNTVIRHLEGGFGFVADVDMIFHPDFVKTLKNLSDPETATYFKVGFLTEDESSKNLPFNEYEVSFYSDDGATGLTLFPVEAVQAIRGFDEFYHFWGSEDTDLHVRLQNSGKTVAYYEQDTLLLHQWHTTYRNTESDKLTSALKVNGIVQINYEHLLNAKRSNRTVVNPIAWGEGTDPEDLAAAERRTPERLRNSKREIDALIYGTLPSLSKGDHSFEIASDPEEHSAKDKLKKVLGKKTKSYYSLKEVNDKLLLQLISYHRHCPYRFEVDTEQRIIRFSIVIR